MTDNRPTPEMIEAACRAYANGDIHSLPYKSGMEAALTAALALIPGEPVGYRYKLRHDTRWEFTRHKRTDVVVCEPVFAAHPSRAVAHIDPDLEPGEYIVTIATKGGAAEINGPVRPAPLPFAVKVKPLEWHEKSITIMPYYAECDDDGEWRYSTFSRDNGASWVLTRYGIDCGVYLTLEASQAAAQADYEARIRSALSSPHPDDLAVDRFAAAMKAKLAKKRAEGYGGWDNPEECTIEHLSRLLINHLAKGDPVDIGNFAMMIHQRGGRII